MMKMLGKSPHYMLWFSMYVTLRIWLFGGFCFYSHTQSGVVLMYICLIMSFMHVCVCARACMHSHK
jgi:hypothetical protein